MNLELSNKVALITGSSRGIGRAIAQSLHAEGCQVALNARHGRDLAATSAALHGSIAIVADMTIPKDAQRAVLEVLDKFGRLDILVCNVGSGSSVSPGNESLEEWHRVFNLNLWSATNIIEAARDALVISKGAVVCISSICGSEVIIGAPLTYSGAKAALTAYVCGMARPLGKQGVRINAVALGNILSEDSAWARKMTYDAVGLQAMLEREVALGRLGTTEEAASLVTYLASRRAAFATGAIWTLDGGQAHR